MAGFDQKVHGLNDTYLEGGVMASNMRLTKVEWIEKDNFKCASFTFANNEGLSELKISNPVVAKPFKNMTLEKSNEFLEQKYSSLCIDLASEFGIIDTLPKTSMSPKQMCIALGEALKGQIEKPTKEFWVKITKNNKGWPEISQERPFIKIMDSSHTICPLKWTERDLANNKIVRAQSFTSIEEAESENHDQGSNVSTSTPYDQDI